MPSWDQDALSTFLSQTEANARASAGNFPAGFGMAKEIQDAWLSAARALKLTPKSELVPTLLMFLSNASWLAAIRVGMGGQCYDVHPSLRATIEYAGYAAHMSVHQEFQLVWLNRNNSDGDLKSCKRAFKAVDVDASVAARLPGLSAEYRALYEAAIDSGAHPNQRALAARLEQKTEGLETVSTVEQLSDDPVVYNAMFEEVVATGRLSLSIFAELFSARLREGGITERVKALRERVSTVPSEER